MEGAGAREAQLGDDVGVGDEHAAAERLGRAGVTGIVGAAPPLQPVVLVAHELRLLAAFVLLG